MRFTDEEFGLLIQCLLFCKDSDSFTPEKIKLLMSRLVEGRVTSKFSS